MREEILRVEKVTQKKNGNVVLDNIQFQLFRGEVLGVIFITAQGKEELVELLRENTPIDYGRVYLKEKLVNSYMTNVKSPGNMITVIGRNSGLIETLNVVDNIFVMREGLKKYVINQRQLRKQFHFWFDELNTNIDPECLAADLTKLERCVVELFRAVVAGSKVIILEEIASLLTKKDLEFFYSLIRYYQEQGYSFLYIGNHHEEVFQISNRVALVRNAQIIRILRKEEMTDKNMLPYSISFTSGGSRMLETKKNGVLNFHGVYTDSIKNMSFSIQKGECVLFLDKSNDIYPEFVELLCENRKPLRGTISYEEGNPQKKILLIPENPTKKLIFWDLSYLENLLFLVDQKMKHVPIRKHLRESVIDEYKDYVGEEIYETDLRYLDVKSLYNLIYYRVHLYHPDVVICVQPFANLDMYARKHVVDLISTLQAKGISVILWSVNLSDCLAVANRLFYMEDGEIKRIYEKNEFYHFVEKNR